jgi:hypothetical protein
VQTLPSSVQAVPFVFFASVGHVADEPVHISTRSHSPDAVRHVVPPLPAGCWHATFVPSHRSSVQTFPSSVHPVPFVFFASVGHVADDPVHVSARSHSPAAARQLAPALPAGCWQMLLVPLQVSVVQGFPSSVHTVPAGFSEQVPTEPIRLQASQALVQAVSQQTLLTQDPLAHCVPDVHAIPVDGS